MPSCLLPKVWLWAPIYLPKVASAPSGPTTPSGLGPSLLALSPPPGSSARASSFRCPSTLLAVSCCQGLDDPLVNLILSDCLNPPGPLDPGHLLRPNYPKAACPSVPNCAPSSRPPSNSGRPVSTSHALSAQLYPICHFENTPFVFYLPQPF